MNRLRHLLANACYAVGRRLDRPVRMGSDDSQFGDNRNWGSGEITHANFQVHMQDRTPVRGSFQPGRLVYAALTVGEGVDITLFLTRTSTRKVLNILGEIERGFREHGEGVR